MSFDSSPEERLIVDAIRELAAGPSGRAHWRERAIANEFPERLWQALADGGYLGTLVPQEHGGAGLGLTEMAVLMEAMASEGMALLLMIVSTTMATIALARHCKMALAATHLELASLMTRKAAWLFDQNRPGGAEANMAKMAAADAGLEACDIAIQVHGGNGFTREYEVMTYWPLLRLLKTAPVSREMILNYIGEHVLGLPKSY